MGIEFCRFLGCFLSRWSDDHTRTGNSACMNLYKKIEIENHRRRRAMCRCSSPEKSNMNIMASSEKQGGFLLMEETISLVNEKVDVFNTLYRTSEKLQKHLAEISRELEERMAKGQRRGMTELSSTITALATYKRELQDASTWPFNAVIIRRLFISILTPGLVYLVKILSQTGIRFGS